jgi:hypothetical protein
MEPESPSPHSQAPATCPYPQPAQSSPHTHIPLLEGTSQYYIPIYAWVSPAVSFPQVSTPNPVHTSPPPQALHAQRISFFSILSAARYWVRSRDHSAPHYVIFSISVTSSLLGQNILLNTPVSNTLSPRSSLDVCDQVSHPYRTTRKITVLYILIFKFSDSKLEDKRFSVQWKQAFPKFNLLLTSSWIEFWFVKVVPKYLNLRLCRNIYYCNLCQHSRSSLRN